MRGSIYRRGEGYTVKIERPRRADGRRQYRYETVATRKEAERLRAKLVHDFDAGTFFEPSKISVAAFLDQWLDAVGDNLAASTRERNRQIIAVHLAPGLGHHRLDKLAPVHIQELYTRIARTGGAGSTPLAPATVRKVHQVLHRALRQAVRWQMIRANPADAVDAPTVRRPEMRALNGAETAQLLQAVSGDRLHVPVLVAVTTGLRRGELLGLRWRDVDLEAGTIAVVQTLERTAEGLGFKAPKTRRSRRALPIGQTTVAALRRHRAAQDGARLAAGSAYLDLDLVFAAPDGRPWSPSAFTIAFIRLVRRCGLTGVRLHDLRHTHASQLLAQGVNVKVVSERLGHSSVAITLDVYAHTLPGMQAAAVDAFDAELQRALAAVSPPALVVV